MLAACGGALLFGLLSPRRRTPTADRAFANVAAEGILGLVVPIAALVIGDAVLGAEVRSGTFLFTWMSPAPTWEIVLGRWVGGASSPSSRSPRRARWRRSSPGPRAASGRRSWPRPSEAVSYVALFIAIGCLTRRTAVWSLAIVFLVERLLGAALTGIAQLSPTWESRAVFVGLLDDPPDRLVREGIPQGGAAIVRLAVVIAVALVVATWRMRHMRLSAPRTSSLRERIRRI